MTNIEEMAQASIEEMVPASEQVFLTDPVMFVFTNNEDNRWPENLLRTFYIGVSSNRIGVMQAYNLDTEEEELVLVGVQFDSDGKAECFPLAKVLNAEAAGRYLAPDGKGGFFDPADPVAVAEHKENSRSFNEAVVDDSE